MRGLDAAYREKERLVLPKSELMVDRIEEINRTLCQLTRGDIVQITYYSDGENKTKTGRIVSVLPVKGMLIMDIPISFSDIYDIEILSNWDHFSE